MAEGRTALSLSFGQVAWSLCRGRKPDTVTLDRLRYLRQLHVPFGNQPQGTGNRRTYLFEHLILCGLGVEAMRRGMKPSDAALAMQKRRKQIVQYVSQYFDDLPEDWMRGTWVEARAIPMLSHEIYVALKGKRTSAPGTFQIIDQVDPDNPLDTLMGKVSIQEENGELVPLLPLTRLLIEWVAWARQAPETPAGRR